MATIIETKKNIRGVKWQMRLPEQRLTSNQDACVTFESPRGRLITVMLSPEEVGKLFRSMIPKEDDIEVYHTFKNRGSSGFKRLVLGKGDE